MASGQGLMQPIGFTEEKIVSRFRIQAVRETVRAFEQAVHQIYRGGGQIINAEYVPATPLPATVNAVSRTNTTVRVRHNPVLLCFMVFPPPSFLPWFSWLYHSRTGKKSNRKRPTLQIRRINLKMLIPDRVKEA